MEQPSFKDRINELYINSGCRTVTEFAKKISLSRQTVDRYLAGERNADIASLRTICEKMNVTADWLIGLSNVSSKSENIQSVVNVLHLSETAASSLMMLTDEDYDCREPLSYFLEHHGFAQILMNYKHFYTLLHSYYKKQFYKNGHQYEVLHENGSIEIDINDAIEYHKYQMLRHLERICSEEQEYLNDLEDDSLWYIDSLRQLKEEIIKNKKGDDDNS